MPFVRSPLPSWRSANSTARVRGPGSVTNPCGSVALGGTAGGSCASAAAGWKQISANAHRRKSFTPPAIAGCGPTDLIEELALPIDLIGKFLDVGFLDQVRDAIGRDVGIDIEMFG